MPLAFIRAGWLREEGRERGREKDMDQGVLEVTRERKKTDTIDGRGRESDEVCTVRSGKVGKSNEIMREEERDEAR